MPIGLNRLFVLGAGFSASAGVPMTGTLLHAAMERFKEECPGLFSRVENYVKTCFSLRRGRPDYRRLPFSYLCTFLEFIELREYGGGERWSDAGSREKLGLKYFLAKTIAIATPVPERIPDLYLKFAAQLHENDIVLTFNWDCVLENALTAIDKPFSYTFGQKGIKICKLHGSINWRLGRPTGKVNLSWYPLHLKGAWNNNLFYTLHLLNRKEWAFTGALGEVEPFLVLPGYGKAFDVRQIATLWYKPEFAFGFTHDVYIIGLSLSHDDYFIRGLFLDNLPFLESPSGIPTRKLFIINPGREVWRNYDFISNRRNIHVLNEKFSTSHIDLMERRSQLILNRSR